MVQALLFSCKNKLEPALVSITIIKIYLNYALTWDDNQGVRSEKKGTLGTARVVTDDQEREGEGALPSLHINKYLWKKQLRDH